jgi:hypothetical protein
MVISKKLLPLILLTLICSCGSRKLPTNSVKIYKGQLNLLEGSYLINSYASPSFSKPLKGIDQFLDIYIPTAIEYLNLRFIDDRTLEFYYDNNGLSFKKRYKGKLKRGAFYIESSRGFIGIPFLFFASGNDYVRLVMGNDDHLILERYETEVTHFFNTMSRTVFWESYYYDRLYKGVHIDDEGNLLP